MRRLARGFLAALLSVSPVLAPSPGPALAQDFEDAFPEFQLPQDLLPETPLPEQPFPEQPFPEQPMPDMPAPEGGEPSFPGPESVLPDPEHPDGVPQTQPAAIQPDLDEKDLDALFADLKRESDPREAERIAGRIMAEWRESGSATVDLLMQWADEAIRDKRYGTALDLLDQVIVLKPDYAEGWNRRATVHYIMDNYAMAMADIARVLALEPRHFGALSGMGAILRETGRDEQALQAFLKALEVYPAMPGAQDQVSRIADELTGDAI